MDDRQVVIDPRNATLRCKAREVSLQAVQAVESARDGEEVTCSEKPLLRFAQGQREREREQGISTLGQRSKKAIVRQMFLLRHEPAERTCQCCIAYLKVS